jgi:hypothetical protein
MANWVIIPFTVKSLLRLKLARPWWADAMPGNSSNAKMSVRNESPLFRTYEQASISNACNKFNP